MESRNTSFFRSKHPGHEKRGDPPLEKDLSGLLLKLQIWYSEQSLVPECLYWHFFSQNMASVRGLNDNAWIFEKQCIVIRKKVRSSKSRFCKIGSDSKTERFTRRLIPQELSLVRDSLQGQSSTEIAFQGFQSLKEPGKLWDLRRRDRDPRIRSHGPPVCEIPPGVFDETGGRRIPIRAPYGLRSGKVVQRSPHRARIAKTGYPKKGSVMKGVREKTWGDILVVAGIFG